MKKMLLSLILVLGGVAPAATVEGFSILGHWEGAVVRLGSVQSITVIGWLRARLGSS
jgi:hypothetical protein